MSYFYSLEKYLLIHPPLSVSQNIYRFCYNIGTTVPCTLVNLKTGDLFGLYTVVMLVDFFI
jgi:hypothetical protein